MAVLTADHHIMNTERFRQVLQAAAVLAAQGYLVTLGIQPSSPATGFGYIHHGENLGSTDGFPTFAVERFVEKPGPELALSMVNSGEYSWNSGMFIWRVDRILEEIERQLPELYAQLREIVASIEKPDYASILDQVWRQVKKQTIDYGVMEGARQVCVIPVEMGWADIGSWRSLLELLPKNQNSNSVSGPTIEIDTHDTLLFGDKRLIAAIGLEGMIVVDTEDALLICPKERDQEVREVIEQLKASGQGQWL